MSVLDAVLLVAAVALAITLVVAPRIGRRAAPFALPVLIIYALLPAIVEDYYPSR
ncbi:hypothetical protein ACIA5E_23980 [Nocardia asteroides]|uniref:hypothetical protein n=1 Tax=Nocardia asteroides TaxID=1824 RepID=UPI0037933484